MTNISETIKMIYDKLQDNESKMIFNPRLLYFLDRDIRHLYGISVLLEEIEKKLFPQIAIQYDTIEQIKLSGKKVIYFSDMYEAIIFWYLKYRGLDVNKYYPINGVTPPNAVIVSPEELGSKYRDHIFLTSSAYVGMVKQLCEKYSANPDNVFSLKVLSNRRQYFGLKFMVPEENEVFVDAGAYNGVTIGQFIQWASKGYQKVYSFECDPDNCEKVETYLSENNFRNVELIRKGVWSEETVLQFQGNNEFRSAIDPEGNLKVPVTSIDSVVGDERVTFIKMDVEGAELEALKGARNCIAKHSPKLAICVYHKPEDILTIPEIILDINPDYSFYLRHHTIGKVGETVLYGIVKK